MIFFNKFIKSKYNIFHKFPRLRIENYTSSRRNIPDERMYYNLLLYFSKILKILTHDFFKIRNLIKKLVLLYINIY